MNTYDYNYINMAASAYTPSELHNLNNATGRYFINRLLQKAMSVFKWEIPDTWNREYFLYSLYCGGYVAIFDTAKYGVIPQQCGLTGQNLFYAPRSIIVSNPNIPESITRTIDVDCVVLKLQPNYCGILDMVYYYAAKMALISEDIEMNLQNAKLAHVFAAANKAGAESFKKLYDEIMSGKPAVFIDNKLMKEDGTPAWQMFTQNLAQNYIVDKLVNDLRKLEQMFLSDIGIRNANTEKRERLISDEVNANNEETESRAALWLEGLQRECRKANAMFPGLNINVDWRVQTDVSNNVNSGAV